METEVWKEAINHAKQWVCIEQYEQYRVTDRCTEPCGSISVRRVGKRLWRGHLSTICRPRRVYLQVSMSRLFQKKLVGQNMHNLPKTNFDFRVPVVDVFVCVGIFANSKMWRIPWGLAEYKNIPPLKCFSSIGFKTDSEEWCTVNGKHESPVL